MPPMDTAISVIVCFSFFHLCLSCPSGAGRKFGNGFLVLFFLPSSSASRVWGWWLVLFHFWQRLSCCESLSRGSWFSFSLCLPSGLPCFWSFQPTLRPMKLPLRPLLGFIVSYLNGSARCGGWRTGTRLFRLSR